MLGRNWEVVVDQVPTCCKSGSFLMIADPLWSCVMLLCGPLRYLVIPFVFMRGCTRLQPFTMQESVWARSTSNGVIVYCYFFYMFWLISKNFLFAILSFFIYADFIRYGLK